MGAASGPDMITDGLVLCLDAGSRESYPVSFPSNGLYGRRYVGYFNDNVNWFETATLHGDVNQLTAIDNFTSNADSYSWQWTGYFKPSTTENYTFFTSSDDASHLWIGDNATAGFTTANANVNNAGLHGNTEKSSVPVSLTKGVYYPIRIQFGENGGGDIMSVSFSTPTISKTRNGLGYYYHGLTTQNTWKDLSNNGNNGTLTNGPLFSEDNIGSIVLDGVNDVANLNTIINSSFTELTCEILFKSPIAGNSNTNFLIWDHLGGPAMWLGKTASNQWFWMWNYGPGLAKWAIISSTSYVANTWIHIAVRAYLSNSQRIVETNNFAQIIVNGNNYSNSHRNDDTSTLGYPSQSIVIGQRGSSIGNGEVSGAPSYTSISVASFKIYNRVLTPAEIQQNYNAIKGRFGI